MARIWYVLLAFARVTPQLNTGTVHTVVNKFGQLLILIETKNSWTTFFYSRNQKATIQTYLGACTSDLGCYTAQLLQCSLTNQTLYVCLCYPLNYWSTSTSICTSQLQNGSPCTSNDMCRGGLLSKWLINHKTWIMHVYLHQIEKNNWLRHNILSSKQKYIQYMMKQQGFFS